MRLNVPHRARRIASLTLLLMLPACTPGSPKPGPGPSPEKPVERAVPAMQFVLSTEGLPDSGNWKCDPVFEDVNGDGLLDLAAIPRLGDGPEVWLGDGHGGWRNASEGLAFSGRSCGGGLCFGDVNRDGHLDLAVADHCQGLYVYLGNDAGHWEAAAAELYPEPKVTEASELERFIGAEDVALGDVNGDGFVDIVAGAADSGGISLWFGDGTGRNWAWHDCELPTSDWAPRVVLIDIDCDGSLDLVASRHEGPRVWLGDGRGGWRLSAEGLPTPQWGGIYAGIDVGDVNEDGRLDVVVACMVDGPEVYLQQPDGSWQKTPDVFPEMLGGAFGLALGDIDQDGHLDMALSGRLKYEVGFVYGVFVLRGDGRAGWTYVTDSGLPEGELAFTWGVALGDVDGDGILDVAAGSGGTVSTDPRRKKPVLDPHMLVWRTRLPERH